MPKCQAPETRRRWKLFIPYSIHTGNKIVAFDISTINIVFDLFRTLGTWDSSEGIFKRTNFGKLIDL